MDKEIYHYDQHDHFFLGPELIVGYEEDRGQIPYAATEIPPPARENWPDGHVPIFDPGTQQWKFGRNQFWEISLDEVTFYTGRDSIGPTYLIAEWNSPNYEWDLIKYVNPFVFPIPRFGSVPNVAHLCQRIDFINLCLYQLEEYWAQIHTGRSWAMSGPGANHYQSFAESLVAAIRRFLDDLTTVIFLRHFKEYAPWKRDLEIDGYSALLGKNPKKKLMSFFLPAEKSTEADELCDQFLNIILGRNQSFLSTIQGLNNSYKHSATANIARTSYGTDVPLLLSYGTTDLPPHGNLSRISKHNHSLRQIALGLNDYLDDLTMRLSGLDQNSMAKEKCIAHSLLPPRHSIVGGPYIPSVS